jgi:CelD/BcsL family acetyltransferase involved in cellulose biosynthesis
MHLELLDRFDDYQRVENIWKDLAAASKCSYFLSWGWIQNWIETLPREVPVKLAVLTNGAGPRSAFFLGNTQMAKQGIFRSKAYRLNQTGNWDYDRLYIEHNSVLHSTQGPCSLQQIVDNLPGKWEELYLSALAPSNFPANGLEISPPHQIMIANVIPCPYVDLQQARENPKGYLALLSSNARSQVKRSYKLYEARGPLVTEVAEDVATALQIYDELIALHEAWWQRRNKPGAFHSDYFRAFHRRLIEKRFQAGEIQLIRLRCGDATVGCLYNFVFRGVVYFYQSGLSFEEDNRLKPGYVCHVEAIQFNAKVGHERYDFLAGVEDYKERLSTHKDSLVWARIQKPKIKFKVERVMRGVAMKGAAWYRDRKRSKPVASGKAS